MKRGVIAAVSIGALTLLVVAVFVLRAGPVARHPFVFWRLLHTTPSPHLPMPIAGVTGDDIEDSWGSPRPGGRGHQGVDIFARRNTPILSTTHGIVMTVGVNSLGGRIVRVLGPGGEWHYYAHLERYSTIRPGDVVQPGTIIGYVGNSGDAATTPTHLHYGIYHFSGGATNPYPRLATSRSSRAAAP